MINISPRAVIVPVLTFAILAGATGGKFAGGMAAAQTTAPSKDNGIAQKDLKSFVAVILGSTEEVWASVFKRSGKRYTYPYLVLYTDSVKTACGLGNEAIGPFYCPAGQKIYLDFSFFRTLAEQFGARGDFPIAYIIAHEVGHHIQNLTGIEAKFKQASKKLSTVELNKLSVRMELQADCLAGVWTHLAERQHKLLEQGDIDEGLAAASALGNDAIQKRTQGVVVPDSFTHGSSAQRKRWFMKGFVAGKLAACDTFSVAKL